MPFKLSLTTSHLCHQQLTTSQSSSMATIMPGCFKWLLNFNNLESGTSVWWGVHFWRKISHVTTSQIDTSIILKLTAEKNLSEATQSYNDACCQNDQAVGTIITKILWP